MITSPKIIMPGPTNLKSGEYLEADRARLIVPFISSLCAKLKSPGFIFTVQTRERCKSSYLTLDILKRRSVASAEYSHFVAVSHDGPV